jgi:phenylpropionate dioxygenase-like ring-hydroxylating dioxygenase large terminal subunit/AcrR family transcriptional regulator
MAQPSAQITHALQDERRRLLIDATVSAIFEHGLSNLTLAKVGGLAGLTAGSVSFHFSSKEALLLATLKSLAEEFDQAMKLAVSGAGEDPALRLQALVDAHLHPGLSDPRKIGVWYAFMSEAGARKDYQKICADRDEAYYSLLLGLFRELATGRQVDAEALAYGLAGLLDQIWQDILFEGAEYDRHAARRRCQAYLASVFPGAFTLPGPVPAADAPAGTTPLLMPLEQDGLKFTLPSWTYRNEEFTALEKEFLFMRNWQLVCHISDLPATGSYVTYNIMNERAFVVRDKDGAIRAFHNVCPHRAHMLVQGSTGKCSARLTCPYHGWTFALDGRRMGVSSPKTFRPHDRSQFGLNQIDCEVLLGFVFIRFRAGGPSVADRMSPVLEEFSKYRTEDMVPDSQWPDTEGFWEEYVDVDWKNAVENYVEDYHFPTGHKGLAALMNQQYDRDPLPDGVVRLSHSMRETPLPNWSVQKYHKLLPRFEHLPESMQRSWTYFGLFPNNYFDLFPDKMDFMQMVPVAPGKMMLRGRTYALPDDRREVRALRYLNDRINTRVQDEDNDLTLAVQKGLNTSGYKYGILSDKEVLVKHFQDWVREQLPVSRLAEEPPAGQLAALNESMKRTD